MYCSNIIVGICWVKADSKLSGQPGTGLPESGLPRDHDTTVYVYVYMRPSFSILIEGLTKITSNLSLASPCPGQDSTRAPRQCRSETIHLQPHCCHTSLRHHNQTVLRPKHPPVHCVPQARHW